MIQHEQIAYEKTGLFKPLIVDYINQSAKLKGCYSYSPNLKGVGEMVASNAYCNFDRSTLISVFKKQYNGDSSVNYLINELSKKNTYSIATGHQLCLFGGPMFSILKIATIINIANQANKKYPSNNFVPVFWLASEDHDLEEVDHFTINNSNIKWQSNQSGAVGRMVLSGIESLRAELLKQLPKTKNAEEILSYFDAAYKNGRKLSVATREFVHAIFGDKVLVLDADDVDLKASFASVVKDDIEQNTAFNLLQKWEQPHSDKYKAQINGRAINFFYLKENLRERIEEKDGAYIVLNTDIRFTKNEILTEIENHPERFSPNVVMRPLYQQHILPNVAYIGGPGEIAYWLQLKSIFTEYKIEYPVLIPRIHALFVNEKTAKRIEQTKLKTEDLFIEINRLIKKEVIKNSTIDLVLKEEKEKTDVLFDMLAKKSTQINKNLFKMIEAQKVRQLNALNTIEKKLIREQKKQEVDLVRRLKELKESMFTDNNVALERKENFSAFYLDFGKELIEYLCEMEFNLDAYQVISNK